MRLFSKVRGASAADDLQISPQDYLKFKGPFNRNMKQEIVLTNNSTSDRFCFKIKSNAPRNRLIVSPKQGIVEPGQSILHRVVLTPADSLKPNTLPLSYSVLIQTVPVGPEVGSVTEILANKPPSEIHQTKLECVFEEAGKEAVTRRPYRRVTLPGKVTLPPATTLSGDLDKAFRVEDQEATLTIRGRPQDPGKPNKKGVLQFQPVVQPPNTATVVFPSLGSNNLGELEIVNRNGATPTVAASGDGNNNSQKNTGSDDWDGWDSASKPIGVEQQGSSSAGMGAPGGGNNGGEIVDNGWDAAAPTAVVGPTATLPAPTADVWGTSAPHQQQNVMGNVNWNQQTDDGWNDLPAASGGGMQPVAGGGGGGDMGAWNNQNSGAGGGYAAGGWDQHPNDNNGAWGGEQNVNYDQDQMLGGYPAPPIAGVDDQIRTMMAIGLSALAVFIFGMLLGKAGL